MAEKSDILKSKVKHIDFDRVRTVEDLVEAYKDSSVQSRALANCAAALENAMTDPQRPTIILGLAGPLIAAGLRKVLADLVRLGIVDVVVSIGAIPYQDFYQGRGFHHYKTSPYRSNDLELREHFIDRIYDTLVDEEEFRRTDAYIGDLAARLEPRGYTSREFMDLLGADLDDEGSILYQAHRHGVPWFVPALNDSSIGIGLVGAYARRRAEGKGFMHIDPIRDAYELAQVKMRSKKTGVIYIGGGVPKNYIQQTEVISEVLGVDAGGHHYAVQITMDSPHWGGLSGCTFEEAQSWGKIAPQATKSVAYVEASIGLSLMAGYIIQKGVWKGRPRLQWEWEGDQLKAIRQVPGPD